MMREYPKSTRKPANLARLRRNGGRPPKSDLRVVLSGRGVCEISALVQPTRGSLTGLAERPSRRPLTAHAGSHVWG